jgi:hypothetical protein
MVCSTPAGDSPVAMAISTSEVAQDDELRRRQFEPLLLDNTTR